MGEMTLPPTIFVVHPRENPRKCSIEPLRGRTGFVHWTFPGRGQEPLDGYVRIGLGGALLSSRDRGAGLLLIDGTWRRAQRMERFFAELPARSLLPWETAYPRVSKREDDPIAGLATIEALFAAHVALGRPTAGLLDRYHWREAFLARNASRFIAPAARAAP
jgi:pre-rRNA-processing protein TSR3